MKTYTLRIAIFSVLSLLNRLVMACEPIVFKQAISPKQGWLNYGLAILMLVIIILVMAKKLKPRALGLTGCQLIEKKHLNNKTVVYIIDYQKQRFLLADNQQALTLHLLKPGDLDEPV